MCKIGLNAFQPENIDYFKKRVKNNIKHLEDFGISFLTLLNKQGGLCPVCGLPISWEDIRIGVDKHHIKARSKGGSDAYSNLMLLHRHCHKQVTTVKSAKLRAVWVAKKVISEQNFLGSYKVVEAV